MKKVLILLICIILIGCIPAGPTITPPRYTDYQIGTDGLEIEFIKSQPPDDIWQDAEIIVGIEIQNKGAHKVEDGKLKLTYDAGYFEMYDLPETIKPLEGKGQFYPEGEKYIEDYEGKNHKELPLGKDEYRSLFKIRACYTYLTQESVDICLNPSEYDYLNLDKEACKANRVFSPTTQGSPLSITRIEEIILPIDEIDYKVEFIIDVENRGDGKVRSPDAYQKECVGKDFLDQETEMDIFEIQEISFSDFSTLASGNLYIDCGPNKKIKLIDGTAQFTCSAVIKKSIGIFQTPLKINLKYGYTTEKQKITKIKQIKIY